MNPEGHISEVRILGDGKDTKEKENIFLQPY
jgi:hypothetical protein